MTTIVTACREIDRLTRAAELNDSDYADMRADFLALSAKAAQSADRVFELAVENGELARENDDLRDQLGRSEDRRYEP
ncbi:hypothetical protein BST28_18535 [Mycolicibacter kumamotonensis]|uniref:Uncharacterized protein n=1 Tax=Mycolicibacter kumamotonensis TaxID=354243 RepID=A0A1X0DXW2_9MYCO|nr:hypothetical protein [Mycolicibacter kumamotonensis]ORA77263.1 hypothetical protein BST28_18535 [Mycolicibacter kumamotonensis]